jgi:ribosomal protein L37AE/L43A
VAVSPPPAKPITPRQVKKKRTKKNDNVKLVGAESHRCPFCLEDIDQNDPRGVKICPICKTYHHADCWDVTGMCQIPHHQE